MPSGVRNQAEAMTWFKARRKEAAKLAVDEGGVREILIWGELPVTKKARETFSAFKEKILRRLKKGATGEKQWSEAEGRALAIALEFTGLFDEILNQARKQLLLIQQKQEKKEER